MTDDGSRTDEESARIVVGYHGTTALRADRVIRERRFSWRGKAGDWLGFGISFWQDAPRRAAEWARQVAGRLDEGEPVVLEARIALVDCLDLLDVSPWQTRLRRAFESLERNGLAPPQPETLPNSLPHRRDCAVIEELASRAPLEDGVRFLTVRAAFVEGTPVFPRSALYDRAHVQIAVREPALIDGIREVGRGNPTGTS